MVAWCSNKTQWHMSADTASIKPQRANYIGPSTHYQITNDSFDTVYFSSLHMVNTSKAVI